MDLSCLDEYTIVNNIVQDLGKFEGEHMATVYFFDAYMNGDPGELLDDYSVYILEDEERRELDLEDTAHAYAFRVDNQGYCRGATLTESEYEAALAEEEARCESDGLDDWLEDLSLDDWTMGD